MKKILVLGAGAQGSTVAQRLDECPEVREIICADHDGKAVRRLTGNLKKAKGLQVDASVKENITKIAEGADLIINALPLNFGKNVLDSALQVKADYQDFAACENIMPAGNQEEEWGSWVEGIKIMYNEYGPKFRKADRLAIIGTGSAPGLICAAARKAVKELDSCETIYNIVYEGVQARRFLPFWWSPVTALSDMADEAYAFENGKIIKTVNFTRPIYRKYDYLDQEVRFVEHTHDEPVHMGLNSKKYFKGARNIYFKYAGAGVDFAEPLFRAGLLSKKAEYIDGHPVVPFRVILKHLPHAPKYRDEIKEIIDEGLVSDSGCMVVEAYGKKDGVDTKIEVHVMAPGLKDSFKKAGITAEMYLTGQAGFLFTKMFLEDRYDQKGLISSDMLTYDEIDHYFSEAEKMDITLDIRKGRDSVWKKEEA